MDLKNCVDFFLLCEDNSKEEIGLCERGASSDCHGSRMNREFMLSHSGFEFGEIAQGKAVNITSYTARYKQIRFVPN